MKKFEENNITMALIVLHNKYIYIYIYVYISIYIKHFIYMYIFIYIYIYIYILHIVKRRYNQSLLGTFYIATDSFTLSLDSDTQTIRSIMKKF